MIEVRGVNTHNKGAHLMMLAISSALGHEFPLTMAPNGARYIDRARAGYRQTFVLNQAPSASRIAGNLIPSVLTSAYGLTPDRKISGVLDASGFAYSDSFSPERAKREALLARGWKRRGTPRIFLPQAFGPFTQPELTRWSRELLDGSSLIYARDSVSLEHVEKLGVRADLRLAPDFTVGLDVSAIPTQIEGAYGAIVPNEKLVTQGKVAESEYVGQLVEAARAMSSAGMRPVVVIHEFNDRRIGDSVAEQAGGSIFTSPNPLILKRVLGDAQVAVASRFHAIVSALSLSTPVAAFGWSHKYKELMNDFGVADWVVQGETSLLDVTNTILSATDADRLALSEKAAKIKRTNEAMWVDVRAQLAS